MTKSEINPNEQARMRRTRFHSALICNCVDRIEPHLDVAYALRHLSFLCHSAFVIRH